MIGIINNEFRNRLKVMLRVLDKEIDNPSGIEFGISYLEEIFKISRRLRRESSQIIRKNLDAQLSLASLHMACCFLINISMYEEETGEDPILPTTWLEQDIPNPNGVFAHLLTQLVLLSLSVTELVEAGLDSAARPLVRLVAELSWQILILLTFKEDLQKYITPAETTEEINQIWFKLFGKGRIQEKLSKIEKMINLDVEIIELFKKKRKEDYQLFSESVHHSFPMTLVGTVRWSFEKDEGAWSAFGGASSASFMTIDFLNQTLNYFTQMFISILNDIHDIYPNLSNSNWREAIVLREVIDNLNQE